MPIPATPIQPETLTEWRLMYIKASVEDKVLAVTYKLGYVLDGKFYASKDPKYHRHLVWTDTPLNPLQWTDVVSVVNELPALRVAIDAYVTEWDLVT